MARRPADPSRAPGPKAISGRTGSAHPDGLVPQRLGGGDRRRLVALILRRAGDGHPGVARLGQEGALVGERAVAYGPRLPPGLGREVLGRQLKRPPAELRDDAARLLAVVLDVRARAQLRHDDGRTVDETRHDLRRMVEAIAESGGAA